MKSAKRITVSGKVQGVHYRASTQQRASMIGIAGWVMNQSDGSVLIHAEGTPDQLSELITWCKLGPPAAVVSSCAVIELNIQDHTDFIIKR